MDISDRKPLTTSSGENNDEVISYVYPSALGDVYKGYTCADAHTNVPVDRNKCNFCRMSGKPICHEVACGTIGDEDYNVKSFRSLDMIWI
jgi:hypothetical protein